MIRRYTRPEMASLWTEEGKFNAWLEVEIAACKAWSELGKIPQKAVTEIENQAQFTVEEIEEIEEVTRHDVIAFINCIGKYIGKNARYFHYGLTSSDVVDTALALRMVKGLDLIIASAENFTAILRKQAKQYKHTVQMGRTHGIHAEPITFGLKLALYYQEMTRNLGRLNRARKTIAFGKLSGAVGTLAHTPPQIEQRTMELLGLEAAPVSTQVIQRDRHAEVLSAIAITGSTIEKIATEIRNLQRSDLYEAEEPFRKGQKGSSAMPHKRNPVVCEQLCGLSRILRSNLIAALENNPLWHERDISHSSVERVIIPDSFCLLHYMFARISYTIENLQVKEENMKANLWKTKGLIFSQKILLHLIDEKEMIRQTAYDIVQRNAMKTWLEGIPFKENLLSDPEFTALCDEKELDQVMDAEAYLNNIDHLFQRAGIE